MVLRKSATIFLTLVACCLLLAGPVLATESKFFSGGWYRGISTVPDGHYVRVCDELRDGGDAYANYNATGGTGTVRAFNGVDTCNSTGYKSLVNWHNICWSGNCMDRSYH